MKNCTLSCFMLLLSIPFFGQYDTSHDRPTEIKKVDNPDNIIIEIDRKDFLKYL